MTIVLRHLRFTKAADLLLGLLLITLLAVGCTGQHEQIPSDAQLLAEVDLAAQPHDAEAVGEFSLAETAVFDLSLSGPDDNFVVLHSEDFRTDENGGGTWEQNLAPGTYQLVLTASQTPGTLSVYWESK